MANEGTSITNSDAVEVPSNYTVCQRSGFRVKANAVSQEWSGAYVRPESYEPRHDQLRLQSRPERQTGSRRPEQDNLFITEAVTPESL